jgi:hypothetical protein
MAIVKNGIEPASHRETVFVIVYSSRRLSHRDGEHWQDRF